MKASELIIKLSESIKTIGDSDVVIEIGYFCGEYGGHNCYSKAEIEDISFTDGKLKLEGFHTLRRIRNVHR